MSYVDTILIYSAVFHLIDNLETTVFYTCFVSKNSDNEDVSRMTVRVSKGFLS